MATPLPALLGRRAALTGAASLLASAAAPAPQPGLNAQAMATNRFFGAAINDTILADDRPFMNHVRVECGMVTGETAFKWGGLRPKPDVWNWKQADALMRFAATRGIQVRGHTMLWHENNPAWLVDELTSKNAETLLTRHIHTLANHCRNRVVQWDVVNEVLEPKDKLPGGFRNTLWHKALGPETVDIAFRACAEADPVPLRLINDYGLEYTWPEHERKRQDMLALLSRLKSSGVPVQGLGLQSHLEAGVKDLDQKRLADFCNDVAGLGLKIVVTELDVRDNRLPADTATRDTAVASHARAYLDAVLSCPAVMGVLTWGLSDRRTWLNDSLPRDDKLPQRPLPLDADLNRKPLWTAIGEAFAAAPMRA
jgi:endo-1,4-beta-xylanase